MLLLPPHTAAEIARATMRRDLGLAEDGPQDNPRNALVTLDLTGARWMKSKFSTRESDVPSPAEAIEPCASATNVARIVRFVEREDIAHDRAA